MKQNIWVSVSGLETPGDEDGQQVVSCSGGRYYKKDEKEYIVYEERLDPEDPTYVIQTMIRIEGHRVILIRNRDVSGQLVFEEGSSHTAKYQTLVGALLLRIHTKKLHMERMEHAIRIQAEYGLELEGQEQGLQKIDIRIFDDENEKGWKQG